MSTVPTDLDGWIKRTGWPTINNHVFSMSSFWSDVQAGKIRHKALYLGREAHEFAHIVCANDHDVFLEDYGIKEFITDSVLADKWKQVKKLSREVSVKEIEVLIVEAMIKNHVYGDTNARNLNFLVMGARRYFDMDYMSVDKLCDEYIAKWDIEKIWAEFQRKVDLLNGVN